MAAACAALVSGADSGGAALFTPLVGVVVGGAFGGGGGNGVGGSPAVRGALSTSTWRLLSIDQDESRDRNVCPRRSWPFSFAMEPVTSLSSRFPIFRLWMRKTWEGCCEPSARMKVSVPI